ncbi:ATP-binding protein [Pseudomonas sp. LJDD11]|uniref:ATP-binding protein n=2 Tax=Pseudomonadota TaxID=1224 RepID=UPI00211D0574|nr:ATP-binding protein [Pseudomonas sp. LJDD11]MCQ9422302.1 ATP-binding protein [Pseudomonas sp. LJDD11]
MSPILAVRIHDRLIELISQDIDRLGKFFEVDSVRLLLGTNGSGKTKILTSLANAVGAPQDESVQFYFKGTPNGIYEPRAPYNETICAIYYSALPYRRKLNKKSNILDASPTEKKSTDRKRLERLGEIARDLEINTRLTGFFGYSRAVFRSAIIPTLKNHTQAIMPQHENLRYNLRTLISGENSLQSENYKTSDSSRESNLKKTELSLDEQIGFQIGNYERCLFLTAIEHIYSSSTLHETLDAALAFLNYAGIITSNYDISAFERLESIVENTRQVLNNYSHPSDFDWKQRTHRFQIDGIDQSESIKNHDVPINIEWSDLSSGLQALVEQFSLIDKAIETSAAQGRFSVLLLIDEGDAYLHLDWQRKYFSLLNKFLGATKRKHNIDNLQLIMATHSPLIAADIPGELVTNLDSDTPTKSFAAPLDDVISGTFGSSSLGRFAADKINSIYRRTLSSKATDIDRNVVEIIGDPTIRSALKRRL